MALTYEDIENTLSIKLGISSSRLALNLEEFINIARINGMSDNEIYDYIIRDIEGSGRFFGAFKNDIADATRNGIEDIANVSAMNFFNQQGYQEWQWITAGKSVCPDCEDRHGLEGDMAFFNTIGLPKSGFSVCQANCQCKLLPIEYKGENLDKPLLKGGSELRR